jgi:hypothetical protein
MLSRFRIPQIQPYHKKDVKRVKTPVKLRAIVPQPLEKRVNFDHEITEFEVKVGISASVLLFSMGMLATKRGDPGMYLPLITSIIGYWTPSPTKNK